MKEISPPHENKSASAAYHANLELLQTISPQIAKAVIAELKKQRQSLKLIASENYSSLPVQLAMGNLLTDKYAEGFPHHRFYGGCENIDTIEEHGAQLACRLFGADHAYIQPHSGADANLVAFMAILYKEVQEPTLKKWGCKLKDLTPDQEEELRRLMCSQTLMGLALASGGHLTHGFTHNISAKIFRPVSYQVDLATGLIDYEKIEEQAEKERPLILLAGYSSYPRRLNFARLRKIADKVGAILLCDIAHFAGLVAGKVLVGEENPVPYADIITSTTHKTLRGPRGGIILCKKEYAPYVNKGCPYVIGGPLPHVMAAKALAFEEALKPDFEAYAKKVVKNAQTLAQELAKRDIQLVTGGTDNHLLVIDLTPLPINGLMAEKLLGEVGLTVNRNMIPGDRKSPWLTSGLRLGTPAITTRGMGEEEMVEIADILANLLKGMTPLEMENGENNATCAPELLEQSRMRVKALLERFPLYPEIEL